MAKNNQVQEYNHKLQSAKPDYSCKRIKYNEVCDKIIYWRNSLKYNNFKYDSICNANIYEEEYNYKGLIIYIYIYYPITKSKCNIKNITNGNFRVYVKPDDISIHISCNCKKLNMMHSATLKNGVCYKYKFLGTTEYLYYDEGYYDRHKPKKPKKTKKPKNKFHKHHAPYYPDRAYSNNNYYFPKKDISITPEYIQWNAAHPYSGGKCSPR